MAVDPPNEKSLSAQVENQRFRAILGTDVCVSRKNAADLPPPPCLQARIEMLGDWSNALPGAVFSVLHSAEGCKYPTSLTHSKQKQTMALECSGLAGGGGGHTDGGCQVILPECETPGCVPGFHYDCPVRRTLACLLSAASGSNAKCHFVDRYRLRSRQIDTQWSMPANIANVTYAAPLVSHL